MAIWMTALKIIPWADVLESAPHIVKAAKRLFSATKADATTFAESSTESSAATAGSSLANLNKRVRLLEARLVELSDEQKSSTELIKSLAEQNALVVEAIEVFRVRIKILLTLCIVLIGVLASLVFWLVMK
ncbi:hypothetical protein C8R32_1346 [Nitrosospira sp. Nsp5]|uniref:Uncharacterized protein n=1 Tax=Nitrosospira multiformis TaxID=1231 RepID=A0ABY0TBF3_9PROT|nr:MULTISPECIES: hypothetical protein [Nitrosospira]PTR05049.1 hypothetical protein C8R32_1346 [Nitrosospira sp. Nsp5]SDQ57714.1 hypothetical protein SAMN05216402_1394 [Nitrosospira multiformis]